MLKRQDIDPKNTKIEVNVRGVRTFLTSFEKSYGKKELIKIVELCGIPLEYFDDEHNWISSNYFSSLLDAMVEYSNDKELPYKFGLASATNSSWGTIERLMHGFGSCTYTYKILVSFYPRWIKILDIQYLDFKRNKATVKYTFKSGFKQTKNTCLAAQGRLASVPLHWNLPPAKICEIQCAAEGADSCIYEINWINPPIQKTGLYFLIIGTIISISIEIFVSHSQIILYLLSWSLIIIIPLIVIFILKIFNKKDIQKDNVLKKEDQNKSLSENLETIEKLNERLQEKVEKRSEELIENNEVLEKRLIEVKNYETELMRTEKMTAIGQLAVEVAHNLKIPINFIQKNILDSITESSNSDPYLDSLAGAKKAADRCEKIIVDLLSFTNNNDELHSRFININTIIEDAINKVREEISNPDIKIISQLSNNIPDIEADPAQLEQVFIIFIINARDAIDEASKNINKNIHNILIKSSLKENNILMEISDTGCGIPKNIINKIFDPFFSTKTTSKRKGIGLTLSYNIIKRLGGKIEVKSTPGSGTNFFIYLPINAGLS